MKPKIMLACYQEGYTNGFNDAMDGEERNYANFPEGKASLSINAYDAYTNGYNHGYLDGLRKKVKDTLPR
ncbi:MAG: hypothetical protein LBK96_02530 [Prevotellaceae bacterium]|jgi:hypothetical protein|nr:hypothetical protein [Prevotellaceae bacterium]